MEFFIYLTLTLALCLNAHAADWDSSGTVKTSGGELHYRIAGTGKPLVLLHGYSGYGKDPFDARREVSGGYECFGSQGSENPYATGVR